MNTCHICNKAASNLPIRLGGFPFDEKAAYIESILDVLCESRFGPAYSYAYLKRPDRFSADDPFSFLDLIEDGRAAWYAADPLLQKPARSKGIESQNTSHERSLATPASNLSPSNLGRGSPQISGANLFASSLRT